LRTSRRAFPQNEQWNSSMPRSYAGDAADGGGS
jgi:hypothetical protein